MPRLLRSLAATTVRCASPDALPPRGMTEVRHFSSWHRASLSVSAAPCAGAGRCWAGCFIAASSQAFATRPFSHTNLSVGLGYISVLASWVHATRHGFPQRATPTLGLGWSICSTMTLRPWPNAADLLLSGNRPYSPAILTYYDPPQAFTEAEVRR